MSEEKAEVTKVKILNAVDYKGVGFAKGATVELEPHIAARLIADGNAEISQGKPEKSEK